MENNKISSYRDLIVWQKAMDVVEGVYIIVSKLPREEKYGLVSQMTRSAVSVPSNIAEGTGRGSHKEYAHFLKIARGSVFELETQLYLLSRLYKIETTNLIAQLTEVSKMLYAIIRRLES